VRSDTPQREMMLFAFRAVCVLWLVWAVVGVAGYWKLAQSMEWDKLSLEANVSIFLGLTVTGLVAIAAFVYLTYRLRKPR
jgi:hypothetical protein